MNASWETANEKFLKRSNEEVAAAAAAAASDTHNDSIHNSNICKSGADDNGANAMGRSPKWEDADGTVKPKCNRVTIPLSRVRRLCASNRPVSLSLAE